MRSVIRSAGLPLAALTLCAACLVTPSRGGTRFDEPFVASIQKGKTTGEEVRTKLGAPASVTRESSGSEKWTYMGWEGKPAAFGGGYDRMRSRMLTIALRNGVVTEYSFTESQTGAR